MSETACNESNNLSAEDQAKMEQVVRSAQDILTAAETAPQEQVLKEGKAILNAATEEDMAFVLNAFNELSQNPEFVNELSAKFVGELGWSQGKLRAMWAALNHALNEFSYNLHFTSPDEKNPYPGGITRDTSSILLGIIADDYGAEVMRDIMPLVDMYVRKVHGLINAQKKSE